MSVTIHVEGLDEEPETVTLADLDEAIAWATNWFLEGYNNQTIDDDGRAAAKKYAEEIGPSLRAGRQFYCPMFYEKINIVDDGQSEGK